MNLLQQFDAAQKEKLAAARAIPDFSPGDTLRVMVKVVEGERTRTQAYEGVVIARSNRGLHSNFTVRKLSYGEGVERVFPLYSPAIAEVVVVRRGKVRRAKLYYLRGRTGKSARIAEKLGMTPAKGVAPAPAAAVEEYAQNRGRLGGPFPYSGPAAPRPGARSAPGKHMANQPRTLFDKIWDAHVVETLQDGTALLYIDRHLVHEVTSPQAFEGLRVAGRQVRSLHGTIAVVDHNIATDASRRTGIEDPESRLQVETLEKNVAEFNVPYIPLLDERQGIVHVIGPELGLSLPGMTIVCGDSHTSTHGAMGALAFGIGTSEVEHVLATQTVLQKPAKNMRVTVDGVLPPGCTAKDITLAIIGKIGTAGGTGHVIEYAGEAIRALDMAGRMTLCNMSIEAGARAGMVAPDETTIAYVEGRPHAPKGEAWERAVAWWRSLPSDAGAHFDKEVSLRAEDITPQVTWGTSPEDVLPITGVVPNPADARDETRRAQLTRMVEYMGLIPGQKLTDLKVDVVFIGSCTNSRIEDIRAAAAIARGRQVAPHVRALVVPGSGLVKKQAEAEGLDRILLDAGFEWREAGCSMCLGMNPDKLTPGQRSASTSNRNFEGRQGPGGRTHLCSPAMAAAAAIKGHLADVREFSA